MQPRRRWPIYLLRTRSDVLGLELAAILDVRIIVRTTYALEGDRLEILLVFRRIEELRALGRALASNHAPRSHRLSRTAPT